MNDGIKKIVDFYDMKPNARIYQDEDWFYSLSRWIEEGYISSKTDLNEVFGFDEPGNFYLDGLGWCESAFCPFFDEITIEIMGEHELVQDTAGRKVLFFKGRRNGFMPEYKDHPVKDMKTWYKSCKWRLDPDDPQRYIGTADMLQTAQMFAKSGGMITQKIIGGYMYLRSLMGPEGLLYMFYDDPALIHECMRTWFELSDKVISVHQNIIDIDELYLAEDICYKQGSLISPDMIREFLFPYYQQLIINVKSRQRDKSKHLYVRVDSDGNVNKIIDVYREIGLDYMDPFEVASGCDVVETGRKYPWLHIKGGFDKRIMAQGKDQIDAEIDRIMPVMKTRGGYICSCDHGVPEEVSFENYCHYRKRVLEYA